MMSATRKAADWLVSQHDGRPTKIIPTLCRQFGLTTAQAIDAIREANRLRASDSKDMTNDR